MSIKRFFNVIVPVRRCNLRCRYCYLCQRPDGAPAGDDESLPAMDGLLDAIRPERMGGSCFFNLCGDGETMLHKDIIDLTRGILSLGHYAGIITNTTVSDRLEALTQLPSEYKSRLFVKCSLQYMELKRLGLLELFFRNVQMLKASGVSFSVELTANDETVPLIPEIKDICMKNLGALCHVVESRNEGDRRFARLTELPLGEHTAAWEAFESPLFHYEQKTFEKYQKAFCYAGVYSMQLHLQSGDLLQCSMGKKISNIYEDTDHQIRFAAVGANCPNDHCFLSYVWLSFCGCCQDSQAPTYAEERDRVCADGSHWLTPPIREAFSRRCSEYHEPYSADKAFFIDMLMKMVYRQTEPRPGELARLSAMLSRRFGKGKVVLYGMGRLGRWLLRILNGTGIEVAAVIDRRYREFIGEGIAVQSPDSPVPPSDAVIVTPYSEFTGIAPLLRKKTDAPVLSIVELAE